MKSNREYHCDECGEKIKPRSGNFLWPGKTGGTVYHAHKACSRKFCAKFDEHLGWFRISDHDEHNELIESEMAWLWHGKGEQPKRYRSFDLLIDGDW